jgi:hypothetical protein
MLKKTESQKTKSQQELRKKLSSLEHAPPHYSPVSDRSKIELRVQYELNLCESGPSNSFFKNIAVIYPNLSFNQMEKLRISFGPIKEGFFKGLKMYKFLKAITSPLFKTTNYKYTAKEMQAAADVKALEGTDEALALAKYMAAKAQALAKYMDAEAKALAKCYKEPQGNTRIMLFSGNFDGKILETKRFTYDKTPKFSRFKRCSEKYYSEHLTLAIAILNVSIFILEDLLPRSVDDEESYKQSLRKIGITDEKSVEQLMHFQKCRSSLMEISLKIKTFFRDGMRRKMRDPPEPKAFHQNVNDSLRENDTFMWFLWETCDNCQLRIDHDIQFWQSEVTCTGCGNIIQALATELIDEKILMATHFRSCNLCEAICGLEITTEDDKIISI